MLSVVIMQLVYIAVSHGILWISSKAWGFETNFYQVVFVYMIVTTVMSILGELMDIKEKTSIIMKLIFTDTIGSEKK